MPLRRLSVRFVNNETIMKKLTGKLKLGEGENPRPGDLILFDGWPYIYVGWGCNDCYTHSYHQNDDGADMTVVCSTGIDEHHRFGDWNQIVRVE